MDISLCFLDRSLSIFLCLKMNIIPITMINSAMRRAVLVYENEETIDVTGTFVRTSIVI